MQNVVQTKYKEWSDSAVLGGKSVVTVCKAPHQREALKTRQRSLAFSFRLSGLEYLVSNKAPRSSTFLWYLTCASACSFRANAKPANHTAGTKNKSNQASSGPGLQLFLLRKI